MSTVHKKYYRIYIVLVAGISISLGLAGCEKPQQPPELPPPNVVVSEVKQEAVPIIMEVPGTVEPVKTVTIIPRVSGYIFERNFTEGTFVDEGDQLYLVDPRPYQAKLDSLEAQLEKDQASLKFWTSEATRYTKLAKQGAGSVEDKEKAIARQGEKQASIDKDKADIENAKLNLSFTKIVAPFSGRIQDTLVHVGDLVHKQETELTTVVQIDPIYVVSNTSRQQVYRVQKLQEQGMAPRAQDKFVGELIMPDGGIYGYQGVLNYISALINPATDTLEVRYEFPNPKQGDQRSLIPGQYIPLRMIVGHLPDALLIPEKSLLQTQEGAHVFVVDKDSKVEKRKVKTGAAYKHQWIVEEGLKEGDRVIADGLQKVRPGMVVKVTDTASANNPSSGT